MSFLSDLAGCHSTGRPPEISPGQSSMDLSVWVMLLLRHQNTMEETMKRHFVVDFAVKHHVTYCGMKYMDSAVAKKSLAKRLQTSGPSSGLPCLGLNKTVR